MMNSRRRGAFTLIELLVAVAIIAILAGMLLPALGAGRDRAWRIRCLNNTKQQYVGAILYAQNWGGHLPVGPAKVSNSWTEIGFGYWTGMSVDGRGGGWRWLLEGAYIRSDLLTCPGMDARIALTNTFDNVVLHYDYRYNWDQNKGNYVANCFVKKTNLPLFSEAAARRLLAWRVPRLQTNSGYSPSAPWNHWNGMRWSHRWGGNAVLHDGSGRWVNNRWVVVPGNAGYSNWASWPQEYCKYEQGWSKYKFGLDYTLPEGREAATGGCEFYTE